MKNIICGLVIILALCGTAFGEDYNLSSGNKTADALIYTGRAIVKQVFIITDGAQDCSVEIYGNTSAAGTVIYPALPCLAATKSCTAPMNVIAPYGIYANMTTAGTCTYNVHYKEF